jgi:hypothetical protein
MRNHLGVYDEALGISLKPLGALLLLSFLGWGVFFVFF